MTMKKSEKGTKKFTPAEKLAIIKEAELKGQKVTLAKYDIYASTFHYWKKKHNVYGSDGLKHKSTKDNEKLIKKLEKENNELKLLLAEKELQGRMKDELLKKKYPELRRKI
jgi:putative transposase